MKTEAKKLLALVLAFTMLLAAFGVTAVHAADNTVKVIVRNETFSTADSAPWTGTLIDATVALIADDSMESVLERAIEDNGYECTVSAYGYISSINGLAEYACYGNGGWMATLNDWFTSDGTSAYTVANGGLHAGDEIVMQYTCSWGADIDSLYGNFDTSLKGLTISGGSLLKDFVPATTDYALLIEGDEAEVTVVAEAYNKNYQVRQYRNDYQPETDGAQLPYKQPVSVKTGDTIVIGVGNPAWPSMNSWGGDADETVYTLTVCREVAGNLTGSGTLSIQDITVLQRCLAEFEELSATQKRLADFNHDGKVNIVDATDMQRALAEL